VAPETGKARYLPTVGLERLNGGTASWLEEADRSLCQDGTSATCVKYDDALINLHWLRASQRIEYKVALLTYKVLHGSAPRYLGPLVPVADLQGRRTLSSAGTNRLVVPSVRLSIVGSRAFSVAAPRISNALPEETTSAQSLTSFPRHLKSWLSASRIQTSSSDLSSRLSNCVM